MFRLQITVMAKFQVKCCAGHKCHMGQSSIQFLWGTDWVHDQNMFVV